MFPGFSSGPIRLDGVTLFTRHGGSGPPLLLLHGFPETHLMWREIAPLLARHFTVVCPDLRGYGQSSCPPSGPTHAPYSKRAMAHDLVGLMAFLGHDSFCVVGHDRGGRVGYRLALDHPAAVRALAVLDVVPTETAWQLADAQFALGFWPWSLLAQDSPLPERILTQCGEAILDAALGGWGSPATIAPPEVRGAYLAMLRDPEHAHAICEEYRAAASIDREHDQADLQQDRRITCPLLALWSATGPVGTWYDQVGGALQVWRAWASTAAGTGVAGGHFFPEEHPQATAETLGGFFRSGSLLLPLPG